MADQIPPDYQQFLDLWNHVSPPTPQQLQHADQTVNNAPRPMGMVEGAARQVAQGVPLIGSWTDEMGGNLAGSQPGQVQAENNAWTQQHPAATAIARGLGGVGSMIGLAAAPEAALGPLAGGARGMALGERGLGPLIGSAGVGGAIEGAGMQDGDFSNRMKGAAIGAGAGMLTAPFAPMIGGMVHNAAQGIGNYAARAGANRALPGAAAVGEGVGRPLPMPNVDARPETMIGDLSQGAAGFGRDIASRGDKASSTVMDAYAKRDAKNQPIGANASPPSKAQQGYAATNATIQSGANYVPPPPRPGIGKTVAEALPGAGGMGAGLAELGAALGFPGVGHVAGMAVGAGRVVKALADRTAKPAKNVARSLAGPEAENAANVMAMRGKVAQSALPSGKSVLSNPELGNAIQVINDFLAKREGASRAGVVAGRVGTGAALGAAAGVEPQGKDAAAGVVDAYKKRSGSK